MSQSPGNGVKRIHFRGEVTDESGRFGSAVPSTDDGSTDHIEKDSAPPRRLLSKLTASGPPALP